MSLVNAPGGSAPIGFVWLEVSHRCLCFIASGALQANVV